MYSTELFSWALISTAFSHPTYELLPPGGDAGDRLGDEIAGEGRDRRVDVERHQEKQRRSRGHRDHSQEAGGVEEGALPARPTDIDPMLLRALLQLLPAQLLLLLLVEEQFRAAAPHRRRRDVPVAIHFGGRFGREFAPRVAVNSSCRVASFRCCVRRVDDDDDDHDDACADHPDHYSLRRSAVCTG